MTQGATVIAHDSCDQSAFQYSDRHSNYKSSPFRQNKPMGGKPPARLSAPQLLSPTTDAFQLDRAALREVVSKTATQAQQLSQATVQQALEMGQMFWRMQSDLKRKEYKAFLGVLGWASTKACKYINLAKTFDGFERSQLLEVELTTLLSLCTNRYSSVVAQLREMRDITQQLVEQLIKEIRKPKVAKQNPINGWKQNRSGGGRRYEVILYDENTGLSIEQQAEAEKILPQRVIAEAIALRAEHKFSSIQLNEVKLEELHTVTIPGAGNEKLAGEFQEGDSASDLVLPEVLALPAVQDRVEEQAPAVVLEWTTEEENTQELEAPTQEFQAGDRVEVASERKGAEFDRQIGTVKAVSNVGCVVESLGKTVWFCTGELVSIPEEKTPIAAEPEAAGQLGIDNSTYVKGNLSSSVLVESEQHLIEEHADFIDDVATEVIAHQFDSSEAQ